MQLKRPRFVDRQVAGRQWKHQLNGNLQRLGAINELRMSISLCDPFEQLQTIVFPDAMPKKWSRCWLVAEEDPN